MLMVPFALCFEKPLGSLLGPFGFSVISLFVRHRWIFHVFFLFSNTFYHLLSYQFVSDINL